MNEDPWTRVAEALQTRLDQLPESKSQLVQRARIDPRSINKALRGEEISPQLRKKISSMLGWMPDGIERILQGDEPEEAQASLPIAPLPSVLDEPDPAVVGRELLELRRQDAEIYGIVMDLVKIQLERIEERNRNELRKLHDDRLALAAESGSVDDAQAALHVAMDPTRRRSRPSPPVEE